MMGLSVVPGLPNRHSTPWATSVSMSTCLPRMRISLSARQRWHDAFGQELDGAQHLGLLHARPLDPEDEAIHAEGVDMAPQLADAIVGIADDEPVPYQLLERHV